MSNIRTKANVQALIEMFESDMHRLEQLRRTKKSAAAIDRLQRHLIELYVELANAPEDDDGWTYGRNPKDCTGFYD